MKGISFGSLRVRLMILVLLAVLPALGIILYSGLDYRQHIRQHALEDALRIAKNLSETHNHMIQNAREVLFALSKTSQVQQQDRAACSKTFADIIELSQNYTTLFATTPNGDLFASSIPTTHPFNVADRPWFQRLLKDRDFVIGEYLIGRLTGKPLIALAYPVLDDTGNLKAILSLGMDLEWLNQTVFKSNLREGTSVSVIDSHGTLFFRYPEPEQFVGKAMPETPIVKAILAKREGTEDGVGIDGIRRLFAFTSLGKGGSSHVSVGIPVQIALAKADRVMKRNLAFLGVIAFLALAAAWFVGGYFIIHPVNRLLDRTKQLANGDLSVRTGPPYKPGEVGQLAVAFDQMATSLEEREAERKKMEEDLRERRQQFQELFDNAPIGYHEVNKEGRFTQVNLTELEMLGYSAGEMVGQPIWDFIKGEENTRQTFFGKIFGKIPPGRSYERCYSRKDGSTLTVLAEDRLLRDDEGKITGLRTTIQDITERKRAEETLKESEEKTRQLSVENAHIAEIGRIISSTLDIEEVYEYFANVVRKIIPFDRIAITTINTKNQTVITAYVSGGEHERMRKGDVLPLAGTLSEEVMIKRSSLLIPSIEESECANRFPGIIWAGFHSMITVPLISKNAVTGAFLLRSFKPNAYQERELRIAERVGSQIAGAIANAQLLIERERIEKEKSHIEEQLRQSQKVEAIGQLAGGIAHDFNNLLTIIKGYGQLSLLELPGDDPLRENIEQTQKAADRAAALTRQLLAFSRRQIMEMKVIDLNDLIRNLEKMLHRVIGEDVELVTFLAKDLGRVKADPGQIDQVIMNVSVNARDAMPKGGKLTIETANVEIDEAYAHNHVAVKPGRYVMLSLSDTGAGMPPEVRDRVFEPFFTTKERDKGTGLGLSTVYGIVKQSGGNIWVYSEPGQGTTFKIYLPLVDDPLEQMKEEMIGEVLQGHETILIVEDEEVVRKLAVRVLKGQGYHVLEAPDGGRAFMLCEEFKEPIHLLLTDVVMPGMSGRKLADRLEVIHPEMKVLYMSGYTDDTVAHHGILEKGVNFIQKPFAVETLARKVRAVLDQ